MEVFTNIDVLTFRTLAELIRDAIQRFGDRPFYGVKKNGAYQWMTYGEFDVLMRKFRTLLKKAGLEKGDRVAVIANNSVEFSVAVYAAYGLGGVVVPMYEVQKLQDWEFIFGDSKPKIAIVGNDTIREKIEGIESEGLEKIFVIHPADGKTGESMMELINAECELTDLDPEVKAEDISDIIYTSGTTGRPRGVVLTHDSVCEDVKITLMRFLIKETDRTLAFLPWAHAFGKTVELHLFPSVGSAIGLVESIRTVTDNLKEVNPTILVSVPKIFNKIYDVAHLKVADKKVAKFLFDYTEGLAAKAENGQISAVGRLQHRVLDKVVGAKIRDIFGTSLRFCISGGASLSKEVASFFDHFGVKIYEGYGMTEHAPIIAVNNPEMRKIGSVGRLLPKVKVEILHDNEQLDKSDEKCGEIVISSPCVMNEYYNDPTATADALDAQGRLHTGDMGFVDEDGCLWITGRVKEQYKLENGKYVVPTALEEKINNSPMVGLSVVFGAGKPYNVVLLHPSDEFMAKFKADNRLESASNEELEKNETLRSAFSAELQKMCADFRGYERPNKFAIVMTEFTIDNNLMTPALKIKRREVEKRFADVLASLYVNK